MKKTLKTSAVLLIAAIAALALIGLDLSQRHVLAAHRQPATLLRGRRKSDDQSDESE